MMKNGILTKTAAVLLVFVLALAGCGMFWSGSSIYETR